MHWLEIPKIISTCYITYGSSDGIWTQGAEIRHPNFFKIVKFLWGFFGGGGGGEILISAQRIHLVDKKNPTTLWILISCLHH